MKKILLLVCVVVIGTTKLLAQQQAHFSQYMMNGYLINPALAGTEDYIDVKVGYRNQWGNSFDGQAPKTYYVTGHSPIAKPHEYYHHKGEHTNWHGVGGQFIGDKTGPTSSNTMLVSYSYNMGITKPKGSGIYRKGGIRACFGLFAGFKQYNIDFNELTTNDPEGLEGKGGNLNTTVPDASVGAWIYDDKWYAGLSAMQLIGSEVKYNGIDVGGDGAIGKLSQHYYLTGGARIAVSEYIDWIPSLLVKGVAGAPVSVDINSRFDYDKKYYLGLSYRHGDAMVFMAGATINYMFEIGYAYDYTINELSNYGATGSHEVLVGMRINPKNKMHNANRFWK